MFHFFIFAFFLNSANTASAPFITKCRADDSNCIKQASQAALPHLITGRPEYGVKVLDPIFIKSLDASSRGLSLKLENLTATGLKNCVFKKVQRDVLNSKLLIKSQCTTTVDGQYEMDGQLLFIQIKGKGDAHVVLKSIQLAINCTLGDYTGGDGQKHWMIKDFTYLFDLKEKSIVELENLFNGNEILGRAARELISSNSNDVVREVGSPIVKALLTVAVESANNFFKNVPVSELALD